MIQVASSGTPLELVGRRRRGVQVSSLGGAAFTPASLPSLAGWWDFSGLGLADGTVIASMSDLSGNAKTMTQATAGRQPIAKTGINGINGLSIGRFDLVDDGMVSTLTVSAVPVTLIGVWKSTTGSAIGRRAVQGTTNFIMGPYNDLQQFFNGGFIATPPANDGAAHVFSFVVTTGSGIGYIDGTLRGDSGFGGLPGTIGLGNFQGAAAAEPFGGDFGELIVCTAALGTTDRQNTQAWLKAKWGTP